MKTMTAEDITAALGRLGELAKARDEKGELVLVGGALMGIAFGERASTRDVDAAILAPLPVAKACELVKIVADGLGLPENWLNDAVKGYLVGLSAGPVVFTAPGIEVRRPAVEQLLTMKLSAWRDDVDISDARRLLREIPQGLTREQVWVLVQPYLIPGSELKAQYALEDLWESEYGCC